MTPPGGSSCPTTCFFPTQTQPTRLAPVKVPCPRRRVSLLVGFTFAPPSRPSSHQAPKPPERETDVKAISTTGLGDDPTTSEYVIGQAPVFPEDNGQIGPARKGADSNVQMRFVAPHNWVQGSIQPLLPRPVWALLASSPPPPKPIRPNLPLPT
ncbi:hypothetical protein EDB85DRAFT_1564472 [Lactarius pseudohatsudake]|nr:hypothetical protein EDB85DRAFT_1564472 [Lactarius pseudohatsudake]